MHQDLVLLLEDDPEQSIPLPTADEEKGDEHVRYPGHAAHFDAQKYRPFSRRSPFPLLWGRDTSLKLVKDSFGNDRFNWSSLRRKAQKLKNPSPF